MKNISKLTPHLLEQHQFQGFTNNCGPFCTAMVISFLTHSNIQGDFIANQMNVFNWKKWPPCIRRIPNSATFPWGIVNIT
ncbi:MAG: hypothetical protein LWX83_18950 [Anaerolineae bacterium]|nr:hypothetical protein [Anaerolineae bacterium]